MTAEGIVGDGARSRGGRVRRGARRLRRDRYGRLYQPALAWLTGAIVVGSVFGVGATHVPILLAVTASSTFALVLSFVLQDEGGHGLPFHVPALVCWALAAYCLLQAAPIPIGILARLEPEHADTWQRALQPFGSVGPKWGSLSLDPGATLVEAAKWFTYGNMFTVATVMAARSGPVWGVRLLFATAVAASLVTIGHGLFGASQVFGLYQPRFAVNAWHVGPLLNPNNLSGYLDLGALCGLGLLYMRQPVLPLWLTSLGLVVTVGVHVNSGSRAGLGALVLGVLCFAVVIRARSTNRVGKAMWGALIGGVGLAILASTRLTAGELFEKNVDKLSLFASVLPMIRHHAWFGVGRGAFESVFFAYNAAPGNMSYTHAENFVLQWAVEWGVPVTVVALGTLAVSLWPPRALAHSSTVVIAARIGAATLVVQNLLDLGLEVPGVAIGLAVALGSTYRVRPRATAGVDRRSFAVASIGAATVGIAIGTLVVVFGRRTVAEDRVRALAQVVGAEALPGEHGVVQNELRAAMLRHPAEPYFPLLGATLAFRTGTDDPIRWIQRALELNPRGGRVHLLLAEVLERRGAASQARLELRLAVTYDPDLVLPAARLAVKGTSTDDDLIRAAPEGRGGAPMLSAIAVLLPRSSDDSRRIRLAREAVARDPAWIGPHATLAGALLDAIGAGAVPCIAEAREGCLRECEAEARILASMDTETSMPAEYTARSMMLRGLTDDAEHLLATQCSRGVPRLDCARLRMQAAIASKSVDRLAPALKDFGRTMCTDATACADGWAWVGDAFAGRGDLRTAARYYERAAQAVPTDDRWLKVADAASRAEAHAQAADALDHVLRRRKDDPVIAARRDAERARATMHDMELDGSGDN